VDPPPRWNLGPDEVTPAFGTGNTQSADISDELEGVQTMTATQTTSTATTAEAPAAQASSGWSGFAIAGFVLSLLGLFGVGSVLGIIFSVLGRSRARRTGQRGEGLAVAGIVIGIVTLLGFIAAAATGHVHFYAHHSNS
jgi:hypothetical protein